MRLDAICHTSFVLFYLILKLIDYDMYIEVKTSYNNSKFHCKVYYKSINVI